MYTGCDSHKWAVIKLLPRSHHGIGVAEISLSKLAKDFSRRLWKAVNQNLKLAQVLIEGTQYFLRLEKNNPASEAARGTLLADFHSWLASFLTESRPPHSFGSFRVRPLDAARNLFVALPGFVSLFVPFAELVPFSRLPLGSVLGGALRALTAGILILLSWGPVAWSPDPSLIAARLAIHISSQSWGERRSSVQRSQFQVLCFAPRSPFGGNVLEGSEHLGHDVARAPPMASHQWVHYLRQYSHLGTGAHCEGSPRCNLVQILRGQIWH